MSSRALALIAGAVAGGVLLAAQEGGRSMTQVRLMTLDPGHFHAALVQKEMYPGVAPRVDVFAPLGPDLIEHLARIVCLQPPLGPTDDLGRGGPHQRRLFRADAARASRATSSCSPAAIAARSTGSRRRSSAGLNVLGDKPWILKSEDLPKLEQTLAEADQRGVVAYDIMTERFEITSILQRALVNDPATFGDDGARARDADPGVYMESVHYLMKVVVGRAEHPAGVVLRYGGAGRRAERYRDAPRGFGAVDAVPRYGHRLSEGRPGRRRAALADHYLAAGFPAGHEGASLPGQPGSGRQRGHARVLLQYPRCLHAARHSHEAERDLGLGASGRIRRYALRVLSRNSARA